ncbi:hypothetical protein [Muriicola soli]|uniref:Uncharacterized protein n=1 Tax=Muriicola soli TaxID=2507538 RepID=A0A411ED07_9FLAO|nr:hypothetical protein [Muriicola soli]QBA65494.1 hypothetical protein EQY75_13720 [Muriicola soli]
MKNYKLTTPRTILFGIIFTGGLIYFTKNGINSMETYEIVLSAVLMLALLTLILLKILEAVKKGS